MPHGAVPPLVIRPETQLTIARTLDYVSANDERAILDHSTKVLQLINGLIRRLSDIRPATSDKL